MASASTMIHGESTGPMLILIALKPPTLTGRIAFNSSSRSLILSASLWFVPSSSHFVSNIKARIGLLACIIILEYRVILYSSRFPL